MMSGDDGSPAGGVPPARRNLLRRALTGGAVAAAGLLVGYLLFAWHARRARSGDDPCEAPPAHARAPPTVAAAAAAAGSPRAHATPPVRLPLVAAAGSAWHHHHGVPPRRHSAEPQGNPALRRPVEPMRPSAAAGTLGLRSLPESPLPRPQPQPRLPPRTPATAMGLAGETPRVIRVLFAGMGAEDRAHAMRCPWMWAQSPEGSASPRVVELPDTPPPPPVCAQSPCPADPRDKDGAPTDLIPPACGGQVSGDPSDRTTTTTTTTATTTTTTTTTTEAAGAPSETRGPCDEVDHMAVHDAFCQSAQPAAADAAGGENDGGAACGGENDGGAACGDENRDGATCGENRDGAVRGVDPAATDSAPRAGDDGSVPPDARRSTDSSTPPADDAAAESAGDGAVGEDGPNARGDPEDGTPEPGTTPDTAAATMDDVD